MGDSALQPNSFELTEPSKRPQHIDNSSQRSNNGGGHSGSRTPQSIPMPSPTEEFGENESRNHMMVRYMYRQLAKSNWLPSTPSSPPTHGFFLRQPSGRYISEPASVHPSLLSALSRLSPAAAFTMSSEVTAVLFTQISPFQTDLTLRPSSFRVPIAESLSSLAAGESGVKKSSFACLVRKEKIVLVWCDSVPGILAHGSQIEGMLVSRAWGAQIATPGEGYYGTPASGRSPYYPASLNISTPGNEKNELFEKAIARVKEADDEIDILDEEALKIPKRPMILTHSVMIGLGMALIVALEALGVRTLLIETMLDGKKARWGLVAFIPLVIVLALFFVVVIVGNVFQMFGPVGDVMVNSRYYSAHAPRPERHRNLELPHITTQMPVYKEGLKGVIVPTVTSLIAAIKHYEEQGGTASIYINDDGMQVVKPELAEARKAYYEANDIGWCARPPHGKDGFIRQGRFKKASNMNYCLNFSIRVEDELLRLLDQHARAMGMSSTEDITAEEEEEIFERAMERVIEGDGGKTWAEGNCRVGEIILLVDCDTRVPLNCLLMGALEMAESPELAILQHASGVMQVVHNVFENAITYFTNLIYISIRFAVGNGDCAPFVGHNAFIRWKALQSVSFHDEDGVEKFWSDNHVSEDFDLSLRLQIQKFIVRLASYHNGEFKEGVSLTVYDELARWEKYAYGCSELIFNPLYKWPLKGPFTKLFMTFLWSDIKMSSKTTILAYIGTYYALAAAFPLSLVNYFLLGFLAGELDQFYMASWQVFVVMVAVFNIFSPLAFAALRHRLNEKRFFPALIETIKWTPLFVVFFGGISYHLSSTLLCHLFGINVEWSSTAKELEAMGFFVGIDRIWKGFKWMYLWIIAVVGVMVYFGVYAPYDLLITDFSYVVPVAIQVVCHALLPFALGLF